jgi:hypothetical protein
MVRYLLVSIAGGLLFAILDGVLNANPLAQRLVECYKPIARESVNAGARIAIDLAYGFVLAGLFLLLWPSPPGSAVLKGVSFGLIAWFFRVVMGVAGQWVVFKIPGWTLVYTLAAGLVEMVLLGVLYGLRLRVR